MTRLGAVLAGGQSRRFGSDKAAARWRGQPLIDHAIAALRPHVDAVVVVGRAWPGVTCLLDRPAPGLGPLGGLNAALLYARELGLDRVLTLPCDAPAVPAALLRRLADQPGAAFVRDVPVIGIWPVTLAGALGRHLAGDGPRSVRAWAAAVDATPLDLAPGERVANVNRPADLAALETDGLATQLCQRS